MRWSRRWRRRPRRSRVDPGAWMLRTTRSNRRLKGSRMSSSRTAAAVDWVEQGRVPDRVVRLGIRRLLRARLAALQAGDAQATAERAQAFLDSMRTAALAL